jgi:hypothetical protein
VGAGVLYACFVLFVTAAVCGVCRSSVPLVFQ